jgi:hypothetical protein
MDKMSNLSNLYGQDEESQFHYNPIIDNDNENKISKIRESINNTFNIDLYEKGQRCDRIFKTILVILAFGILIFLGIITYFIVTHKL